MEPVINQAFKLKNLLSRFTRIIFIDSRELDLIYSYIFYRGEGISVSEDSEIYETIIYLRDLAQENNFRTIDDLCRYFDQQVVDLSEMIQPLLGGNSYKSPDFPSAGSCFIETSLLVSPLKLVKSCNTFSKTWTYRDFLNDMYRRVLANDFILKQQEAYKTFTFFGQSWRKFTSFYPNTTRCIALVHPNQYYFEHYIADFSTSKRAVSQLIKCIKFIRSFHCLLVNSGFWKILTYGSHKYANRKKVKSLYASLFTMIKEEKPIYDEEIKMKLSEMMLLSKLGNSDFRRKITPRAPDDHRPDVCWITYEKANIFAAELYNKHLSDKKWAILKSPVGHSWITSDNPGFIIDIKPIVKGNNQVQPDPLWTVIDEYSMVYFPLSKEYCLRLQPESDHLIATDCSADHAISFELSSEEELKVVNSLVFSSGPKVVLSEEKGIMLHCKHD